jgi:hypothetical protein
MGSQYKPRRFSIVVPFSCKTRLFCPSCHEAKVLIWIEDIKERLLLDVPHRFWTFSVPKRLRYYFLRNRKLLGLMVTAANNTIIKAMGQGKHKKWQRPGIIALIQTHSGVLEWNAHLHLLVTDGVVDYRRPAKPKFKPCTYWDIRTMTELFRFELIEAMFKAGVLTADVANNLFSWRHSFDKLRTGRDFTYMRARRFILTRETSLSTGWRMLSGQRWRWVNYPSMGRG